jgi:hypothetical protein
MNIVLRLSNWFRRPINFGILAHIAVNDVVMVVRCDHDCWKEALGVVFKATSVIYIPSAQCAICGRENMGTFAMGWNEWAIPVSWLKRIDPLSEPESVERGEDITV